MSHSADELKAIAEAIQNPMSDAVEVNKRITAAYHELSRDVQAALGAVGQLDWCGFAKWSSHTVGLDLDPTQLGGRIGTISDDLAEAGVPPVFVAVVADALRSFRDHDPTAAAALRAGNGVIFLEMSLVFRKLIEFLAAGRRPATEDADKVQDFAHDVVEEVRDLVFGAFGAGISSDHLVEADATLLERGIVFYWRAGRELGERAELMLAGSMTFSMFEQKRADRVITIGLCAPARAAVRGVVGPLFDESWLLASRTEQTPALRVLDQVVAELLTRRALVVKIADNAVRLGRPELLEPRIPVTLPEVQAVLDPLTTAGNVDWTRYDYRLGVIRRYFDAFQGRPEGQRQRV